MIAMISHSQLTFDQSGNSLSSPQLGSVSMSHRPLGQETNKLLFCFKVSRGGRPGAALAFSAFSPPDCNALRHRITLLAWQPMRRPISWSDSFCFRNVITLRLRSSSNLGDPLGRIETPPFRMSLLYCIIYAEVNSCEEGNVAKDCHPKERGRRNA